MNLNEAFRALNALNEDTFSFSDDGINKLSEFEHNDDLEDDIKVIDTEAETEDDLQDSYVGKVILDCSVCHSKLYKDREEVSLDEEGELANVGEECPYCYTSDGFKVIGEVSEFNDSEDDETDEDDDASLTEAYLDVDGIMGEKGTKWSEDDLKNYFESEKDNDPVLSTYNGNCDAWIKDTTSGMRKVNEGIFSRKKKGPKVQKDADGKYIITTFDGVEVQQYDGGKYKYDGTFYDAMGLRKKIKQEKNAAKYRAEGERRNIEARANSTRYSNLPKRDSNKDDGLYDPVTDRHYTGGSYKESLEESESVKEGIFNKKKKKSDFYSKEEIEKRRQAMEAEFDRQKEEIERKERERGAEIARGWKEREDRERNAQAEYNRSRYNSIKGDKSSNTGHRGINYSGGDYYSEDLDDSKSIKESVNNVNVETDDSIVNVSSDENGKVTVTTEPNESSATNGDGEVLSPISDETEDTIMKNSAEDLGIDPDAMDAAMAEEDEEDADGGDESVDADVEEFDEESFDELGESYLKNIYENVNGYKTTNVSSKGNRLFIEGNIKFNSGKIGKTSFIFEAKDITKSGTARFIGENKNITRGKKSFTIKGKLNEGKFISESLNYNYRAKDNNGKSSRIYGTVRVGKRD